MKKIISIIMLAIAFTSCDRVTQNMAIKHNDAIVTENDKMVDAFDKLVASIGTFKQYRSQIESSIKIVNTTTLKDSLLQKSAMEMANVFKSVGEVECIEVRELYAIPDSLYTEVEEAKVKVLLTAIDDKLAAAQDKHIETQKAFAKKYNFRLESATKSGK
jgi:hypothetical protein